MTTEKLEITIDDFGRTTGNTPPLRRLPSLGRGLRHGQKIQALPPDSTAYRVVAVGTHIHTNSLSGNYVIAEIERA